MEDIPKMSGVQKGEGGAGASGKGKKRTKLSPKTKNDTEGFRRYRTQPGDPIGEKKKGDLK